MAYPMRLSTCTSLEASNEWHHRRAAGIQPHGERRALFVLQDVRPCPRVGNRGVYYKRKYQAFYELCETFARENGRLRKLAYDAHSCIERLCAKYGCDGCPLLHDEMEPCDFASILAEMRELGMEVE